MTNIVLSELSTGDLYELLQEDLYDGFDREVVAVIAEALGRGAEPFEILTKGLVAGMDVVGLDFRQHILFVPEVLVAAQAMKAGMARLRPLLAETQAPKIGTVVIGTVRGDIHDIGKNLVVMMLEGAGFEVIDMGNNTPVEKFLAAVVEHQADILGMSALLTTTMPYIKVVVDALADHGLRDKVRVMVGGAPLNEAFAREYGADIYCRDARGAVEAAKRIMQTRQGERL
ncbi:MAG: corrinoid protein [Caldilineales bacterium]|nr:corrinoid protein [Caldilineales bacterium]MCW5860173.1 corrinoid protein [Caldilineales bacterium]